MDYSFARIFEELQLASLKRFIETQEVLLDYQPLNYIVRFGNLILSQKQNLHKLSVLVIVNLITAGLGFITKVKIANTLTKAGFGLFAYALAIAACSGAIIRFGLDRTLVRDLIHFPKRQGRLVASSLLLRGFLFLVVTLALFVWKYFSPTESDLTWGVVLVVLGHSMIGLELKAVYDSWGKMNRHAFYYLIYRCLYFTAVWLTIILTPKHFSVFWIGVFLVLACSLYMLLQGFWAFKRIDFSGIKKTIFNDTFVLARGNLIIWFSCIGALLISVFNQLILKHFSGLESLGNYAAGWQIASIAMIFLTQIARIGNPAIARVTRAGTDSKTKVRFLFKYSAVMLLSVLPVSLTSILYPELILKTIFRLEYITAAASLRVLGFYMLVFSVGLVASQYVISARMERLYFVSVLVGGVFSLTLCLIMIPMMGDVGAALALLVSHGLTIAVYWCACVMNIKKGFRIE